MRAFTRIGSETQLFYKCIPIFDAVVARRKSNVEISPKISKKADTRIQRRKPPIWKLKPDRSVPISLPDAFDI